MPARISSEGIADSAVRRHPLDQLGEGRDVAALLAGAVAHVDLAALAALDLLEVRTPEQVLTRGVPLRRTGTPDEVAAAVAFCCSREGRVLNGSVVAADGGFAG